MNTINKKEKTMATKKKTPYESRLEYNNTYNRTNYKSFSMRLNINEEADLIDWLKSQDSTKEYLVNLIRKDMEKSSKKKVKKKNKNK